MIKFREKIFTDYLTQQRMTRQHKRKESLVDNTEDVLDNVVFAKKPSMYYNAAKLAIDEGDRLYKTYNKRKRRNINNNVNNNGKI